jgi:hypothetical protein
MSTAKDRYSRAAKGAAVPEEIQVLRAEAISRPSSGAPRLMV